MSTERVSQAKRGGKDLSTRSCTEKESKVEKKRGQICGLRRFVEKLTNYILEVSEPVICNAPSKALSLILYCFS